MLSPNLLTLLRQDWKAYHPRHCSRVRIPVARSTNASAYRICQQAAQAERRSQSQESGLSHSRLVRFAPRRTLVTILSILMVDYVP